MPIAEIYGGISAFKAMMDMAKALKGMSDAAGRNAAVIELQEKILSAQATHSALLQRVGELEEKVRGFENWETEKQRYELKDLGWGAMAYMLKPAMREGTIPHWVCTNCFAKKEINIIQYAMLTGVGYRHICWTCRSDVNPAPESYQTGTSSPRWLD